MKKEYEKLTNQKFDENMKPVGVLNEIIVVSLIADAGKRIKDKRTGLLCTRVDIGINDKEDNYEEVDIAGTEDLQESVQ